MIMRNKKYIPLVVHGLFAMFLWAMTAILVAISVSTMNLVPPVSALMMVTAIALLVASTACTLVLGETLWEKLNEWCKEG